MTIATPVSKAINNCYTCKKEAKLQTCSGCHTVSFCSDACKTEGLKTHVKNCIFKSPISLPKPLHNKVFSYIDNFHLYKCARTSRFFNGLAKGLTLLKLPKVNPNCNMKQIVSASPNITQIDASDCNWLTNEDLLVLCQLPLIALKLSGCSEITDDGLKNLPKSLVYLDLSICGKVTDVGTSYMEGTSIKILKLGFSEITDATVSSFTKMPLFSLDLMDCNKLTDKGIKQLASLKLGALVLSYCKLTDQSFIDLAETCKTSTKGLSQSLQKLDLSSCKLTNKGLCHLGTFTRLKHLNLSGCKIKESGKDEKDDLFQHLKTLRQLEKFYIRDCEDVEITPKSLIHIKHVKDLRYGRYGHIKSKEISKIISGK